VLHYSPQAAKPDRPAQHRPSPVRISPSHRIHTAPHPPPAALSPSAHTIHQTSDSIPPTPHRHAPALACGSPADCTGCRGAPRCRWSWCSGDIDIGPERLAGVSLTSQEECAPRGAARCVWLAVVGLRRQRRPASGWMRFLGTDALSLTASVNAVARTMRRTSAIATPWAGPSRARRGSRNRGRATSKLKPSQARARTCPAGAGARARFFWGAAGLPRGKWWMLEHPLFLPIQQPFSGHRSVDGHNRRVSQAQAPSLQHAC
jgi:hypothetical protein